MARAEKHFKRKTLLQASLGFVPGGLQSQRFYKNSGRRPLAKHSISLVSRGTTGPCFSTLQSSWRVVLVLVLGQSLVLLGLVLLAPARADEPGDELETLLLQGLDNLEDESAESFDRELERHFGEDVDLTAANDPLTKIGQQMRQVEQQLAEQSGGKSTRRLQEQIVKDLAALIDQARRASRQSSSGGGQKSPGSRRSQVRRPRQQTTGADRTSSERARQASQRAGQARVAQVDRGANPQALMKDAWGHLPERAREQMLQFSAERFLPKYELLLEKYYRRLAEMPDERP